MGELSREQQLSLEEWKEARSTIARFDENLVSLRKFGFTLTTLLLTTDAYLSIGLNEAPHPWVIVGSTIVLLILVFALFLLDRHIYALQVAAANRAQEIEDQQLRSFDLSCRISHVYKKWETNWGGTPVYVLFIVAAGLLGYVALSGFAECKEPMHKPEFVVFIVTWALCLAATLAYHFRLKYILARLDEETTLDEEGKKPLLCRCITRLNEVLHRLGGKTKKSIPR
jgi:hypothetical protein